MQVLLDARALPGHRLGVAQYAFRLVEHVASGCDLHVLAKERDADDLAALGASVRTAAALPRALRLAAELTIDALSVNRARPDVYHGLHYTLPPGLRVPATVTFHDATMLTMPEVHERSKAMFFARAIPAGIRRAERVICVSESARQGAIDHAGADPARTHTVHLAVDHDRYHPGAGDPAAAAAHCEGPFLLWLGAVEPRKDVPTLVRAFERIATQIPHRLVLAGPDAWGADDLDAALASLPASVRDRVVRTGWISEDDKVSLFAAADAFVYPSLAEGFGLPVLEAMACGTPTVTTTGSAPEEVAGDAALLVAPGDDEALAAAIVRAVGEDAERLAAAGVVRASRFTWAATAAGTLDVWRLACR